MRERVSTLPGVESAALFGWMPLGFEDTGTSNIEVAGYARRTGETLNFRNTIVSPGFFATLRIPLVAGRDFTDRDDAKAPRVVIVNETFAQRFWPGQDAVGRVIKINGREVTIVGVAKAGKYRALNDASESFFYLPNEQNTWQLDLSLCVRVSGGDPSAIATALQQEIHAIDPNVEVWRTLTLTDYIGAALMPQKIASSLLTLLSAVALVLAAMGVYAVMAYAVNQRTQEFGVRMALGASPADVLRQVIKQGLTLAIAGVALGLVLATGVTRLLGGFLYGVSPFDAVTFAAVCVLLMLVALLASYVPALRATRVNPIEALRAE